MDFKEVAEVLEKIKWLGHASFVIEGSKRIYIDPWKISYVKPADLILVTHSHYDHLSLDDIRKIRGEGTWVVGPKDVTSQVGGRVKTVKPFDSVVVEGVKIETIPAYNPAKQFHPKANGWVGFIVEIDGMRYYQPGDTDLIDEMRTLKNIDVAVFPVGGKYTMDWKEAAEAAKIIKPKYAIPMHWGEIIGDRRDAERFVKALEGSGIKGVILEKL
ncbi:MAG: MBL fold metallo-hydrolase [Thermoplasmata archaeon]|nr:MBL fold metallo-hydrolase [Thermoplasmata archaeon]